MSDKETKLPTTAGDEDSLPPPIRNDDPVSLSTTHGPIALTRNQADGTDPERFNTITVEYYEEPHAVSVGGTSDRGAESRNHSKGRAILLDTTHISTTIHQPSHSEARSQTHHPKSPSPAKRSRKAPSVVQQTDAEEQPVSAEGTRHRQRRRRSSLNSPMIRTNQVTRRYYSPEREDDEKATQTWEEKGTGWFGRLAGHVFSRDHSVRSESKRVSFLA